MLKNLKTKFDEALKKEQDFTKTPRSSEEIRAHNQKAGWAILVFGLILAAPNLYLFYYEGEIWIYLAVLCLFCIGAGIYAVITGKLMRR